MSGGNPIQVLSISSYGSLPFAGGDFTNAGGVTVNNITRWGTPTSVHQISSITPGSFSISQNYPNPFNPNTKIIYDVKNTSMITINVYDITGKEAATLVNNQHSPGTYETEFDAGSLSSGIYFYTLLANGERIDSKKMILNK
jgi:hypothetical protein